MGTISKTLIFLLITGTRLPSSISTSTSYKRTTSLNVHGKVIVLSYDGFRFDYLNKTDTPNLDYLRGNGLYVPYLMPQFLTKTFPNHQSIATGLFVESHGIIDHLFFDPQYDRVLSGYRAGDYEFWNFHEDVAPIWIWNERAGNGRVSGVQFPGSDTPYGKNKSLPTHALNYEKSRTFEARVDYVINWITDEKSPANLALMYFDEPDSKGHEFGPNSNEVKMAIERMDGVTGYLIDQLKAKGIFEDVNIIILSDHGFEEVQLKRMINLKDVVSPDLYKMYGKTPAIRLAPLEGKLDEVYAALKSASRLQKSFSIHRKEDFPEDWHYNNRRVEPILVLAEAGYVFDDFEEYLRKKAKNNTVQLDPERIYGVHGYNRDVKNMRAFLIAHGPAFKQGVIADKPVENVDLVSLISKIIGIEAPINNGSFERVKHFLSEEILQPSTNNAEKCIHGSLKLSTILLILIPIHVFLGHGQ